LLPQPLAVRLRVLRPAHPVRPAHGLAQQFLALFQGQAGQVVTIEVEQVEEIQVSRVLPGALANLAGVLEVKALLQGAEAGAPGVVEADDFAVDQGGPVKAGP
jgi:hypothetical protein